MPKGHGQSKGAMVGCSTSPEDRRLKLLILDVLSKSLATPILTFSTRKTTVLKLHGKGTVRGILLAFNEQFF